MEFQIGDKPSQQYAHHHKGPYVKFHNVYLYKTWNICKYDILKEARPTEIYLVYYDLQRFQHTALT